MNQTGRARDRLRGDSRRAFAVPLALILTILVVGLGAVSALALGPPIISATAVTNITSSEATLQATLNPNGAKTEYRFEYLTDAAYQANPEGNRFLGATRAPDPNASIPKGEEAVPVTPVLITGLVPATLYHFRLVALHAKETTVGPEQTFATFPTQFSGLPDNRAYEQASPVNKDAGDVLGTQLTVKASPDGGGVSFISTVGIPGGVGAQEMPMYLASRGSNWSTQGLLPPPSFGETVRVIGWTPDFANFYESATKFGEPQKTAFLQRPRSGAPIKEVAPYTPKGRYNFAGASADGQEVIFESPNKLPTTAGLEGHSNVYAWDAATAKLSLASVGNKGEAHSKEGSFAGPYDWIAGENAKSLGEGGSARQYYTQDTGAVSEDGAAVFTAAGSGQLYLRLNPTKEQSKLNGKEECEEAAKACTLHLSESQKKNGTGKEGRDVAGSRPAAFMAATHDGSKVFFTSAEKLTEDANTGAEPAPPTIGRVDLDGESNKTPKFIEAAATGMAVSGEHIYWANPSAGTIDRAKLNGTGQAGPTEAGYVKPGPIKVEVEPGQFEEVPSKPQYVAVANGYLYWSDATDGKDGHGVIGRAKVGPTKGEEAEAEWIKGASNPQGIAANASTVYWANAGELETARSIGAAQSSGTLISEECIDFGSGADIPEGVALDASHLYWTLTSEFIGEDNTFDDYVKRADLACEGLGKNRISLYVGHNYDIRGIALDGGHAYWVEERKGAIGRSDLDLTEGSTNREFLSAAGSAKGIAVDGEHVYWSANGEVPANPGNDLYRYDVTSAEAGKNTLTDITVDEKDPNGAEVKGVLGASEDGSILYFAANGVLDTEEKASPGDCKGALGKTGTCNLYRWEADGSPKGKTTFVTQLDVSGDGLQTDATNWTGTSTGAFTGQRDFRKTAWMSADGDTLLFRSQLKQSAYENDGKAELYRYRAGEGILCVSCIPSGAAPSGPVSLGSINPSASIPEFPAAISSRNFAAGGERVFFESTDALVAADTNGEGDCDEVGADEQFPSCLDVYEWEAPGTGSCAKGGVAYSPLNGGCLYLLSSGKSSWPSFFIDASESGSDAFLFTREGLVGQDKDELLDVYDARVGGGIAAQNLPLPNICESSDGCHGPVPAAPTVESPGSATFVGPPNSKPKHKKAKKRHHKKHRKHNAKGRASR